MRGAMRQLRSAALSCCCCTTCAAQQHHMRAPLSTCDLRTRRRVVWTSAAQPGLAFALRYPQIMMHAVSRDTSSFPKHCIYIQIDDGSEDMQQGGSGDDEEDGEQDADVPAEVRLVPEDTAKSEREGARGALRGCVLACAHACRPARAMQRCA